MDFWKDKVSVVTGATGLIGSNLVDRLLALQSKVIAIGRSRDKLCSTFRNYTNNPLFSCVEADVAHQFPALEAEADFFFHAAGPMEGDIIRQKPVSVILPNIFGLVNCLEYLKKQQARGGRKGRLAVFSSVTVYANASGENQTFNEQQTCAAEPLEALVAPYSESKRMSEVIARAYWRQYGADVVMARFSTVYGPTRNVPNTAFYEFLRNCLAGRDITVNSPDAPRRDNLYVDDAVEGLLEVVRRGESGEAYNVSSGGDLGNFAAVDEIASAMARIVNEQNGTKVCVKMPELMRARRAGIILENNKLKSLGWQPRYSLEEGLRATIKKFQRQNERRQDVRPASHA